jgi:glycosyltransferase involved in cell wall biosynthesis
VDVKVCLLTTSFPRSKEDHSGIFVFRLCRALVSSNIGVDVVAPGHEAISGSEIMEGCRVHRFSYFFPRRWQKLAYGPGGIPGNLTRNPWRVLQLPFFLLAFFFEAVRAAKGADLIHAQWIPSGFIAWGVSVFRGIPFIITLRGSDALYARRSGFLSSISLWVLKQAAIVTTINEELRAWLMTHGIQESRVVFIRNGVDLESKRRNGDQSPFYRLLFVGNLIPVKGVRYLIDAFSMLIRFEKEVHLTFIGEGEERAALERQAQETGISASVEFIGVQPPEEIESWMNRSDCLVLPSLSEGTPNVVLEAMACGLPVVASDLPGIREVVRDGITGLLTQPRNTEDLAQKLLKLIRDRSLSEEMGRAGQAAVAEMGLGWKQVAGNYREVYQRVCAGSQGSSI